MQKGNFIWSLLNNLLLQQGGAKIGFLWPSSRKAAEADDLVSVGVGGSFGGCIGDDLLWTPGASFQAIYINTYLVSMMSILGQF